MLNRMSGSEGELLTRINQNKEFFQSVLQNDVFDDWELVAQLGEFLIRIEPESNVMGHILLLRARRHLGDLEGALAELKECRARFSNREQKPWEPELLVPVLAKEEELLSGL